MATTPQIDGEIQVVNSIATIPSKTYKLNINETGYDRIIGYVDNLEAVKQVVYHILMTERYSYLIYDNNYGIELQQYIGKSTDYLVATIEDTLKEALTYDLRITDVIVNAIYGIGNDKVLVDFTVQSIYGNLQLEVNINV